MTRTQRDWNALEQRLLHLESAHRRTRRVALLLGSIAIATLLMGQAAAPRSLKAEEIAIVDAAGKTRAVLGTWEKGSVGLRLLDEQGVERAVVKVWETGAPSLILSDEHDTIRMAADLLGENGEPSVALFDAEGVMPARLCLEGRKPSFEMYDENRQLRMRMTLGANGWPKASFHDVDGKPFFEAP